MNWRKLLFYFLPFLLVATVLWQVNFKSDLSAFIIAGDNAEEILLASEMQSGTLSRRYLISVGAADQAEVNKAFINKFKKQLAAIDGVVDVWFPGQQTIISQAMHSLYGPYANGVYSLHPEQELSQLFSEQGLFKRAKMLKTALLSPQGAVLKKIAVQDPLLLSLNGFQGLAGQMQQVLKQDLKYRNLILETAMAGLNAPEQSRIQGEIKQLFKQLKQSVPNNYQLEMTGVPVFASATQSLIQGDIVKVSVLSTVALVLLFLLIFRSFFVMFQVFSVLIIVILTSILSTQLIFGYVHGMTVAIGSTLVGICIDYPIHAVAHAQAVNINQRTAVIAKIWPSMLLGGITTMIGYTALGFSGYPGFQQVAVYAATGIIVSLLLTRFVFPHLITATQSNKINIPTINYWRRFCLRFKPVLLVLLVSLLLSSVFGLKSLQWMEDMQELTPELDYLKQKDKVIRARMTSIEPGRFVLITGENNEAALQISEQVYPVLDQLKQTTALADYFALYPWLISAETQHKNQLRLQQYLTAENKAIWQQALQQQGLSVKRLGQLDYLSNEVLTLEQVLATPISKLIDSRVIIGKQQTIIMLWLGEHQPEILKNALAEIDGAQYFSQRDMLNNMTKDYTYRAKVLLMLGLLVIVSVLIIRFKSIIIAIQTLLPAILSAFLILVFWSFTAEAISFLHLVGFLLVVAICVDYGIFYQENRGEDIAMTYQAMAASMLTSAVAFGSLMLAESTSLKILAGVVALGVVLGFVLCPLIIKTRGLNS